VTEFLIAEQQRRTHRVGLPGHPNPRAIALFSLFLNAPAHRPKKAFASLLFARGDNLLHPPRLIRRKVRTGITFNGR